MKLPRDLSGREFAHLLRRFGYEIVRQEGSHLRLTSSYKGKEHHVSIPDHVELKVGTVRNVLQRVADYLEMDARELVRTLFGG